MEKLSYLMRHAYFLRAYLSKSESVVYTLLRVAFGLILLTHGIPKVLGEPHGSMGDPLAASINLIQNVLGLPFAPQLAMIVTLLETVGAILLTLGFFTRVVALLFCGEMIGISIALGPVWPWIDRGIEYPVLMGFLAFYLFCRGGGDYSADWFMWRKYQ